MVAKEKLLIFIATIIVIFIIVALVFPAFSNMLPLENPFLQGKDALIRYYACSLAICTQGCNWLSSNDICLKRNIWGNCTMTCKTEICDKQPGFDNCGNKGSCCDDTYSIYLSLKGNARFWSKNEYIPSVAAPYPYQRMSVSFGFPAVYAQAGSVLHAVTEIDNILENFNKNEKKPGFPVNIMSGGDCQLTPARYFSDIPIPPYLIISKKYGLFYKMGSDDPSQITDWSQRGSIYMIPSQAEPQFTCMGYDRDFGYSECTFKGYLQIYSWDPNKDNCADVVVINGEEPFTGDFAFYAANGGQAKIPIDHTGAIALYILNGLGMPDTFTIKLQTPLPAGITCDFDGEDTTKISGLQDTKVGTPDVPLTCKPTALPPPGGFEVWVKAWDGTKTHAIKLKIDVGDFELKLLPPSSLTINAGNSGSFIFNLTNAIGIDVTFQLTRTQSPDNNVGCTFSGGITSIDVADSVTKQITLNCAPNSNARNKNYDIIVKATYDTTERAAVAKVNVPNCSVTNLALKFLDSSNTEIVSAIVNSGDAVKLKADGFSGCQNMNVKFILSVGSKILYQNSVGTSGDSFYSNFFTANSPEKWEMYVQMDENGDGTYEKESPRKNLIINAPTPGGYGGEGNANRCAYAVDEYDCGWSNTNICDQCNPGPLFIEQAGDCVYCLDSQSCLNKHGYYSSASNVCCIKDGINGLDTYSPGLTDAPCLSPDTNTHADDASKNQYFNWKGVDYARNLLVSESNIEYSYPAEFKYYACNDANECKDSNGYIDAECGNFVGDGDYTNIGHTGKECKIKNQLNENWYSSWLFIKISATSRPVYGIKIKAGVEKESDATDKGATWDIYVHKKSGDGTAWTNVGRIGAGFYCWPSNLCIGKYYDESNLKPDPQWSWDDIDALLIAFKSGSRWKPGGPRTYDKNGFIDYIGLLTKDINPADQKNITYCTDGPGGASSPSTYRTIDNGKKCYWGVDCDAYSGNGWTAPNDYSYIGPFKGTSICDCGTDTNNCGDGVCGPVNLNGQNYRFDNVRCVYGGWMGNLVKI